MFADAREGSRRLMRIAIHAAVQQARFEARDAHGMPAASSGRVRAALRERWAISERQAYRWIAVYREEGGER